MYIILPNKLGDLDELISKIDSSTIQRTRSLLEKVVVKLSLPKFKFTSSVHLNEILKAVSFVSLFFAIPAGSFEISLLFSPF